MSRVLALIERFFRSITPTSHPEARDNGGRGTWR
jgi:hypothetical protein